MSSVSRASGSGYDYFLRYFYNQVYQTGAEKPVEEIRKMAEERWKCLTAAERRPYKDIAEQERERLGLEMPSGGITISTAESNRTRKRKRGAKAAKDPNQPKRATTAFFFFAHDARPEVKKNNPEFKVTEISKELGRMWRDMTDEAKAEYVKKADEDKRRYIEEKAVYDAGKQTTQEGQGEDEEEED